MSESTARATRRDLRRAIGPQAIDTIAHQNAKLETVRLTHNALVTDIHARLTLQAANLDEVCDRCEMRADDFARFHRAPLKARLRWLVTGRFP